MKLVNTRLRYWFKHHAWIFNVFPHPEYGTGWWKAFWCRWCHKGTRCSSGWPAASSLLHHSITCDRCGAQYEICQPNTPQYAHTMPFQKPDLKAPASWDEYHALHPIS